MLRIEFKVGRAFSEAEVNNAREVAIVNTTFVHKYLPNENPMGSAYDSPTWTHPTDGLRSSV